MQEHLEAAASGLLGNDLRIRKLRKNGERYRHGESE
jgi:hypothetical protein